MEIRRMGGMLKWEFQRLSGPGDRMIQLNQVKDKESVTDDRMGESGGTVIYS